MIGILQISVTEHSARRRPACAIRTHERGPVRMEAACNVYTQPHGEREEARDGETACATRTHAATSPIANSKHTMVVSGATTTTTCSL